MILSALIPQTRYPHEAPYPHEPLDLCTVTAAHPHRAGTALQADTHRHTSWASWAMLGCPTDNDHFIVYYYKDDLNGYRI